MLPGVVLQKARLALCDLNLALDLKCVTQLLQCGYRSGQLVELDRRGEVELGELLDAGVVQVEAVVVFVVESTRAFTLRTVLFHSLAAHGALVHTLSSQQFSRLELLLNFLLFLGCNRLGIFRPVAIGLRIFAQLGAEVNQVVANIHLLSIRVRIEFFHLLLLPTFLLDSLFGLPLLLVGMPFVVAFGAFSRVAIALLLTFQVLLLEFKLA